MPLKTRDVISDFLPREGVINLGFASKVKDMEIAQKAQENYALSDVAVYAPGLDEEYLKNANREVSYSSALSNMYRSLNSLDNKIQVPNTDDAAKKSKIETEKQIVQLLKKQLEAIYPQILNQEYPETSAEFDSGVLKADLKGDAKPVQFDEKLQKDLATFLKHTQIFINEVQKESPRFQAKTMEHLNDYIGKVNDKMAGKKVVIEEKSDQEIIQDVKNTIGLLIKDDSNAPDFAKVDRKRAMTDLAKKLAPLGMEAAIIQIEEKTPQEELLSQAKTCALRAAWDGFIERPSQYNCSPTLRERLNHPRPGNDNPKQYNLGKNEIWKICKQMPEFAEIKGDLQKALANRDYPADKISELSYADMAYLICEYRQPSAAEVRRRQKQNKNEVDGVKLQSSGRAKFFKKYARKHEADLVKILEAKGLEKSLIKQTINLMKAGKSNDFLDGHHNFAINDPDAFCKATGKKWWQMNDHVVLMDKDSHSLLHAIENNVTARGVLLEKEDNSKTSHRTIFNDARSGKKFYIAIRVKEGIDGLMGLHRETIYNQDYLMKIPPKTQENQQAAETEKKQETVNAAELNNQQTSEKAPESAQAEVKTPEPAVPAKESATQEPLNNNQKALQRIESKKADLAERKEKSGTEEAKPAAAEEKTPQQKKQKNQFNGRPNYQGRGGHGGTPNLGNRRGR